MIVAWQFTTWNTQEFSPSRRDGLILSALVRASLNPQSRNIPSLTARDTFSNPSMAVNCQATIDQSLRDENTACAPLGIKTTLTSAHLAIDGTKPRRRGVHRFIKGSNHPGSHLPEKSWQKMVSTDERTEIGRHLNENVDP